MKKRPNALYQRIEQKKLQVSACCEVGVYLPENSNVIDFIDAGISTILVEPDPTSFSAIEKVWGNYQNVTLHQVAIYKQEGFISLSKAKASTFVSELTSTPAIVNHGFKPHEFETFQVPCTQFVNIDPGNLDVVSIDVEGAEWFVIQTMSSRPAVISLETHGKMYVNPYLKEMENWLRKNNYRAWYKDQSDTVYYRKDAFSITFKEQSALIKSAIGLWILRYFKKTIRLFWKKPKPSFQ